MTVRTIEIAILYSKLITVVQDRERETKKGLEFGSKLLSGIFIFFSGFIFQRAKRFRRSCFILPGDQIFELEQNIEILNISSPETVSIYIQLSNNSNEIKKS